MSNSRVLCLELIGAVFTMIFGTTLHFLYEWTGQPIIAVFSAVNESVWEHMKIAFWPALIFAFVQFFLLNERPAGFIFAKTVNFYLLVLTIPLFYYGYTALTGRHYLWIDITIFIVVALLAHYVSYKLMVVHGIDERWNRYAIAPLIAIICAFSLFTFFPPRFELFKDPRTGGFGIG